MIIDKFEQYHKLSIQERESLYTQIKDINHQIDQLQKDINLHGDTKDKKAHLKALETEQEALFDKIGNDNDKAVQSYLDALSGSSFWERDEVIYKDFCEVLDNYTIEDYNRTEVDAPRVYRLLTELRPSEDGQKEASKQFALTFCVNIALDKLVVNLREARELNFLKSPVIAENGKEIEKTTENLDLMFLHYEKKFEERKAQLVKELSTPWSHSTDKAKAEAEEVGAIMSIGGRLSFPSLESMKDAFNPRCIFKLRDGEADQCDENGRLQIFGDSTPIFDTLDAIHTAFLGLLLQLNESVEVNEDNHTLRFTLYAPTICRELGVDPRANSKKRNKEQKVSLATEQTDYLANIAKGFDRLFGSISGNYYRVLSLDSVEYDNYRITLSTPYIFQLKKQADKQHQIDGKPTYNKLIHSDVMNQNQTALALASRILNGLLNRGDNVNVKDSIQNVEEELEGQIGIEDLLPDAKKRIKKKSPVVYTVKWQTLIDDTPQLESELKEILNGDSKNKAQEYNVKLQRTFTQAFDIIEHHSDAPTKWLNFTLPKRKAKRNDTEVYVYDYPTRSTIQTKFKITHNGKAKPD